MGIGEFLKNKRKEKGLSIRKLSEISGVSHPYISQIETGKNSKPSHEILHKLSLALDVNYLELMFAAGYYTEEEKNIQSNLDDFFNPSSDKRHPELFYSLTERQQSDFINRQVNNFMIDDFRQEFYPDIAELLNMNVYFNKYKLTKSDKKKVYNILCALFDDKEKSYPTEEEIAKEFYERKNMFEDNFGRSKVDKKSVPIDDETSKE